MSWSISKTGCRCAVRQEVENDPQLPPAIKAAILSCLQEEEGAPNGVRVEGAGHQFTGPGSWRSGIGGLVVEPIELVCKKGPECDMVPAGEPTPGTGVGAS